MRAKALMIWLVFHGVVTAHTSQAIGNTDNERTALDSEKENSDAHRGLTDNRHHFQDSRMSLMRRDRGGPEAWMFECETTTVSLPIFTKGSGHRKPHSTSSVEVV